MGTDFLIIILLWCGDPNWTGGFGGKLRSSDVMKCRREAIACVRGLKDFNTDDVIAKCLK